MSVPVAYDAGTLTEHIVQVLGPVADVLEWVHGGAPYSTILTRTLIGYGVSDIADATDIPKLLALAEMEAWRLAVGHLGTHVTFSADGQSVDLSDMVDEARKNLADARFAAMSYAYPFTSYGISYVGDPYIAVTTE